MEETKNNAESPPKLLRVAIEVDLEKNQTKILGGAGAWGTIGVILEAIGVLVPECAKEQQKTNEEIITYIKEYVDKVSLAYNTEHKLISDNMSKTLN